jgi:hypothetical protein
MHLPPWQLVEQQSAAAAHESPRVRQALAPGSGWQAPALQRPVQHSVPPPQAAPVALHSVAPQRPPVQASVQHSPGLAQAAPAVLQKVVAVQVLVVALQAVEQHPAFPASVQSAPAARQVETGVAQRLEEGLQYPSQHSELAAQGTPSFLQAGGGAQCLLASQEVEQQSEPNAQVAPLARHGAAQCPVPSQDPEQQSASRLQPPASAVQAGAAAQALGVPVQMPVQHSEPAPQLVPLAWHGLAQWLVASQVLEQHSPPAAQVVPLALQGVAHTLVASQKPEQQAPGAAGQEAPLAVHVEGAWQVPPLQRPVQHSPPAVQVVPFPWHGVAHRFVASQ